MGCKFSKFTVLVLTALILGCVSLPFATDKYEDANLRIRYPKDWFSLSLSFGRFSVAAFSAKEISSLSDLEAIDSTPFFIVVVATDLNDEDMGDIFSERDLGDLEIVERDEVVYDGAKGRLTVTKGEDSDYAFIFVGRRDDGAAVWMMGYAPRGRDLIKVYKYMGKSFRFKKI